MSKKIWLVSLAIPLFVSCSSTSTVPINNKQPIETISNVPTEDPLITLTPTKINPKPKPKITSAKKSSTPIYYKSCADAPGPINKDEPGYRPKLDKDHDGVACESA